MRLKLSPCSNPTLLSTQTEIFASIDKFIFVKTEPATITLILAVIFTILYCNCSVHVQNANLKSFDSYMNFLCRCSESSEHLSVRIQTRTDPLFVHHFKDDVSSF
ncbi:unnamed protein product [Calicophoron daubneyi]|uniref:Uncharacterized protein n=1 Tax=Calicophoron daubneyi TaxID=300641 RepID=A0AAV2TJT7_CALDB